MRKTWIKLKRGVLDPKHVRAIGPALWAFGLMIDAADWDTGLVRGWTDAQAAQDLGIEQRTMRDWRQRLAKFGYIECKLVGQSQDIQIHNWTNPREYSGEVTHKARTRAADVGEAWGDIGDVTPTPQCRPGDTEGDTEGDIRAERPFIESTYHIPQGLSKDQTPWVRVLDILQRGMPKVDFETWVRPTELMSLAGDVLTIGGANSIGVEKLANGYRGEIEAAVREVFGRPLRVRFVVMEAA